MDSVWPWSWLSAVFFLTAHLPEAPPTPQTLDRASPNVLSTSQNPKGISVANSNRSSISEGAGAGKTNPPAALCTGRTFRKAPRPMTSVPSLPVTWKVHLLPSETDASFSPGPTGRQRGASTVQKIERSWSLASQLSSRAKLYTPCQNGGLFQSPWFIAVKW